MKTEQGLVELSVLNAEYSQEDFSEVHADLLDRGLPPEITTRLKSLWGSTKKIGGEVINIGRIIVMKIVDFIRENSNLALGIAIGAAVGAIVSLVPFVGPLLAPLITVITTVYGALVGSGLDDGNPNGSLMENAISLAKKFFKLLAEIFNSLKLYWEQKAQA